MNNAELPLLTDVEIRVLGSLIEKNKTTPDYYPMTLNSLTAACNQKSSRHPVVEYDEETVISALNSLKGQSLIAMAHGGGSRVAKYKHNFTTLFEINDQELAALCLLMLRGPLTAGEINNNSGRLFPFNSLQEVQSTLEKLMDGPTAFVTELPRRSGQKERRFAHLLSGPYSEIADDSPAEPARKNVGQLESRIEVLESELAAVKQTLSKLLKELGQNND
jgi:uncharacterized protein YceH (UPF0502 family)